MRFIKDFLLAHSGSYKNALARIRELEAWQGRQFERDRNLQEFCKNSDTILKVLNNMGDDESKVAYKNEIVTVLLGEYGLELTQKLGFTVTFKEGEDQLYSIDPSRFPEIEYLPEWKFPPQVAGLAFVYPQYEYKDKVVLEKGGTFLDCGACAGEVAVWASEKVGSEGNVFAFEPSPRVFELLKRNLNKFAPETVAVNAAIGNSEEMICFSEDNAPWSKVVQESQLKIPTVRIDQFCAENEVVPTLIKMDIEGFEIEGLKGAKNTIKKYKPDLTICTYHTPFHVWEVGAQILESCSDYRFYFKKHQTFSEAVLYATVKR